MSMFENLPLFPTQASTLATKVDLFYLFMWSITAFFTLLIFALVFGFAMRYRKAAKVDRTEPVPDMRLEVAWIVIPAGLCAVMFFWGAFLFFESTNAPKDAMDVYVIGKQWMWKIQHPEGKREINELHIPVGRPVRLIMSSVDVIHSFYIPAFRVKMDVVPGRYTEEWFQPTKTGRYHLFCAEYCGTLHSGMIGSIVVMEPVEYEKWLSGDSGAPLQEKGRELFSKLACASCHQGSAGDEKTRGPRLEGVFGSKVMIEGTGPVVADEAYIRESILDPRAKVVAGYVAVMPSFQGQVSEEQLIELVAYIKSIGAKATSQKGQDAANGASHAEPGAEPRKD